MDMSLPLDAREVLFHLNYMGYRNITKEQLKNFMTGKKKLKFHNMYFICLNYFRSQKTHKI